MFFESLMALTLKHTSCYCRAQLCSVVRSVSKNVSLDLD